jgi:hypothetical protein
MIAYLSLAWNTMPTIRRFANCKIAIYADDHTPPHFHVEGRGFRAVVEIETMVVRAGDMRKASEAMGWARQNVALLRAEWSRLNRRA